MSLRESIVEGLSDNLKTLVALGLLYVAGVEAGVLGGYPAIPDLPDWWQLVALVVGAVAVVGYIVGGKIAALLPEPRGTYIIAQEAGDGSGGEVWELNEEAWSQLHVKEGELHPWSASPWDVYECWRYNPSTNVAVSNWRGEKPASELLSTSSREEIQRQIRDDLREEQKETRLYKAVRQALPSIVRKLDKRRAKAHNAALEEHTSISFGEEDDIDTVIRDRVPDEALPDYMSEDDDDRRDDVLGVDLLDDTEALDPVGDVDGVDDPILNDGGTER